MTRKEAKQLLPIIQAFAEGKTIEVRVGNDSWVKTDEVYGGRNNDYDYRIKPEPKYRPFKDAEECWQEMQEHQPFGGLKQTRGMNKFGMQIKVTISMQYLKLAHSPTARPLA